MTFVVMGMGTAFNAVVNRRDPTSGLVLPVLKAAGIGLVTISLIFLATQLPTLQAILRTVPLDANQWLECAGLAALLPLVVEVGKLLRRRRHRRLAALPPEDAVAPARARTEHPVAP